MKYVLGIQTVEFCNEIVMIKTDGTAVGKVRIDQKEQTVELLKKSVEEIFEKTKLSVKDIDLVSVCLGPGSYTGTRGGVAFAKGLCQFSGIPLVGVSAFEVLEANVRNESDLTSIVYLLDARNERIFYMIKTDGKQIKTDSVNNAIAGIKSSTLFVGSGAIAYQKLITKKLGKKAVFVKEELNELKAEQVARVGLEKFGKNRSIFTKDYLYKVKPLYILPPTITTQSSKVDR